MILSAMEKKKKKLTFELVASSCTMHARLIILVIMILLMAMAQMDCVSKFMTWCGGLID